MSSRSGGSDEWEGELSTEFDRRVRDLRQAPLSLEHVKAKATGIRRRRRTAAAASALVAAAAVTVPVAVLGQQGQDRGSSPEIAGPPIATDTLDEDPAATALLNEPAYIQGASYHQRDGSVVALPTPSYESVTTLGERIVAVSRDDDGNLSLDLITDQTVSETHLIASEPAVSTGRDVVAYVSPGGEVRVVSEQGQVVIADGYTGWSVRAVNGGASCLDPVSNDCRLILVDDSGQRAPVALDSAGTASEPVPGALAVTDATADGRLSVITEYRDFTGSCGGVYNENTQTYAFRTCDFRLGQFSPDGRRVLAVASDSDGLGASVAYVLDARTGEEEGRLDVTGGHIRRLTWVDGKTIAASTFSNADQSWRIVTNAARSEGSPRTVVGPLPGTDAEPPIHLVEG